jgi:hypothetical protein
MAEGADGAVSGIDAGADAPTDADPLRRWTLSSVHAATLLVVPLLVLYAVDALGSLLQGVHTATGLGLYLALWGLTWWTNGRWLAATRLDSLRGTLRPAALWGAVTGVCFLLVLLVAVALSVREPVLVAALALAGTPVSALVGAVVGVGFAAADLLVVSAGERLGTT